MSRSRQRVSVIRVLLRLPVLFMVFVFELAWVVICTAATLLWELVKLPFVIFGKQRPITNGHDYEYHVARFLRRRGYYNVTVTQASGDFGVDVIAHKGRKKYAVQCKYYSAPVGVAAVQEAVAGKAHYKCNAAMVVTNSTFTPAAETLAAENGVLLLDGIE